MPETPRVLIGLGQASLTHDLVLASRVFALHLLPATPNDALVTSLSLVHTLGMRSGHAGDKMAGIAARPGVTGSPILAETLTYVEARVVSTLDGEELTIFLADVVGGGRLRDGEPLTLVKLFSLSYFLGMLARYFPTHWIAMSNRQTGDRLFPLLRAGSDLVQQRFPIAVLRELEASQQ